MHVPRVCRWISDPVFAALCSPSTARTGSLKPTTPRLPNLLTLLQVLPVKGIMEMRKGKNLKTTEQLLAAPLARASLMFPAQWLLL